MDTSTYDDVVLTEEQLEDTINYLIDNLELDLITFEDEPISVEPPEKVVLRVTYTEPGFKGDTATGGTKPATTQTGLVVQVPLFVSTDDLIRVNTTVGKYVKRAQQRELCPEGRVFTVHIRSYNDVESLTREGYETAD